MKNILMKKIKEYALPVLIPIALVLIINTFILDYGVVPSPSMAPVADEGTFIVGSRLSYLNDDPDRGDVVIFTKDGRMMVKRVIGISGDYLFFKDGQVYRNGELLEEPYLLEQGSTFSPIYEFYIPEGEYFLMGDNRKVSDDSRRWDVPTILRDDISSKALYVIPFKESRTEKAGKII